MKMKPKEQGTKVQCGLCGSTTKPLTKTECCGYLICDDAQSYQLFSYARNSCFRNHSRYTLCSHHYSEDHTGRWQECNVCVADFDLPNYVYYGTNEYNFEIFENPTKITIKCAHCNFIGCSADDFTFQNEKGFFCPKEECQKAVFKH